MENQKEIENIREQIVKLQNQLNDLSGQFYKNNFTSSQTFNKDCVFNSRLRVPVFTSAPSVAEVGDLISVSAKLYICTAISPVVFTLVGSQS